MNQDTNQSEIPYRAKDLAAQINKGIIDAVARKRQRVGFQGGERASVGIARPAMDLIEITADPKAATSDVVETAIGCRTAVLRIPRVLSRLSPNSHARRAAEEYATAYEKLHSVGGQQFTDTVDASPKAVNDGGVASRTDLSRVVSLIRDHAKSKGVAVILAPSNAAGDRQSIAAVDLLDAICLDGQSLKAVLIAHGWSGQSRDQSILAKAFEGLLDDIAEILGIASHGRVVV